MSIISDALLESLLSQGYPIIIIPESYFKKKKLKEDIENGPDINEEILGTRLSRPKSFLSGGMIPSPVPG